MQNVLFAALVLGATAWSAGALAQVERPIEFNESFQDPGNITTDSMAR